MKNSKLIFTLRKCSEKELQLFQQWLNSPFHNQSELVKSLFQFAMKAAPHFEDKKIEKRKAFKYLFKNQPFNEQRLNNVVTKLTKQLFEFLAYQNYQKTGYLSDICLMDELMEKDLDDLVLKEGRKLEKKKAKSMLQNSSHFFDEYLYYKQLDEHFKRKPKRVYDENLQLKNDHLDMFYIATKLKIACDMTNRNTVIKAHYNCHFLENIRSSIEANFEAYEQQPAITIYYQILKMLESDATTDYKELNELLAANLKYFPSKEIALQYGYSLNFCIKKINQGNADFYKEILELYKFLLENRIIFENGYLLEWDYKNVITVGTRLEELDWTEQFIHEYKQHLQPRLRENAYIYNLANFYYSTKAYKKSLQLLHEVKFTDTSYHLGAKIIQLKSYYELNESEAFYALNDAFRIYLLRSKDIAPYRKQANMNLIRLATKIYKLKDEKEFIKKEVFEKRYQNISAQVNRTENLANSNWVKSCLERLSFE